MTEGSDEPLRIAQADFLLAALSQPAIVGYFNASRLLVVVGQN